MKPETARWLLGKLVQLEIKKAENPLVVGRIISVTEKHTNRGDTINKLELSYEFNAYSEKINSISYDLNQIGGFRILDGQWDPEWQIK